MPFLIGGAFILIGGLWTYGAVTGKLAKMLGAIVGISVNGSPVGTGPGGSNVGNPPGYSSNSPKAGGDPNTPPKGWLPVPNTNPQQYYSPLQPGEIWIKGIGILQQ